MSAAIVKAAKQFDSLVAALPLGEVGEDAQRKQLAELQAENDVVGQELQTQLEAAGLSLAKVFNLNVLKTRNEVSDIYGFSSSNHKTEVSQYFGKTMPTSPFIQHKSYDHLKIN